jgi:DNA-binding SARP family transcriptional activator
MNLLKNGLATADDRDVNRDVDRPVADLKRPEVSSADIVELFPYGIAVFGPTGVLIRLNRVGAEFLGEPSADFEHRNISCCELFGCRRPGTPLEHGCLTELARNASASLPEIRLDLETGNGARAVWTTAARFPAHVDTVLVHLRPGDPRDRRRRTNPHWTTDRQLRISALGRTRVQSAEGSVGGNWLGQRPGQLLKYLVTERHRAVQVDEIAEALWPGGDQRVANNVRHFVHALRERLEPGRPKRARSTFLIFERGGYRLDPDNVVIDADEFETAASRGLDALRLGDKAAGIESLTRAAGLYTGEFLSDEPYAIWALGERDRLRDLSTTVLSELARTAWQAGDHAAASDWLERLAAMHPLDPGVERQLIALALLQGRHSLARRRFSTFRMRVMREFGQEPEFQLADVVDDVARGNALPFSPPRVL